MQHNCNKLKYQDYGRASESAQIGEITNQYVRASESTQIGEIRNHVFSNEFLNFIVFVSQRGTYLAFSTVMNSLESRGVDENGAIWMPLYCATIDSEDIGGGVHMHFRRYPPTCCPPASANAACGNGTQDLAAHGHLVRLRI